MLYIHKGQQPRSYPMIHDLTATENKDPFTLIYPSFF